MMLLARERLTKANTALLLDAQNDDKGTARFLCARLLALLRNSLCLCSRAAKVFVYPDKESKRSKKVSRINYVECIIIAVDYYTYLLST